MLHRLLGIAVILFAFMACESDEKLGFNLVNDSEKYELKTISDFDIKAYQVFDSSSTTASDLRFLGSYSDNDFGRIGASFAINMPQPTSFFTRTDTVQVIGVKLRMSLMDTVLADSKVGEMSPLRIKAYELKYSLNGEAHRVNQPLDVPYYGDVPVVDTLVAITDTTKYLMLDVTEAFTDKLTTFVDDLTNQGVSTTLNSYFKGFFIQGLAEDDNTIYTFGAGDSIRLEITWSDLVDMDTSMYKIPGKSSLNVIKHEHSAALNNVLTSTEEDTLLFNHTLNHVFPKIMLPSIGDLIDKMVDTASVDVVDAFLRISIPKPLAYGPASYFYLLAYDSAESLTTLIEYPVVSSVVQGEVLVQDSTFIQFNVTKYVHDILAGKSYTRNGLVVRSKSNFLDHSLFYNRSQEDMKLVITYRNL